MHFSATSIVSCVEHVYHENVEPTAGDATPEQGAASTAADKIGEACDLLTAAFEDTRVDSTTLSKAELLAQIATTQHVLNAAWAVQSARLAQAGAIEDVSVPDSTAPDGVREREVQHAIGAHQAEFIGCEIGPLLGWTTGHADDRVHEATDVITRTPRLFARVGTGELEPAKLTTIHRALGRVLREVTDDGTVASRDLARSVEAALLGDPEIADTAAEAAAVEQGNVDLLARQSAAQVRHRTARVLASLDPAAADEAAGKRRRERVGVFAHPDDEPGLSHVHAILPSAVAAKVMAAVDRLARELHTDTTTGKTLAECRADATHPPTHDRPTSPGRDLLSEHSRARRTHRAEHRNRHRQLQRMSATRSCPASE